MNEQKVIDAVEKYLKNSPKTPFIGKKEILGKIQHKNNLQFITNGFTAYIFNTNIPELETLDNELDENECVNIFAFIHNVEYSKADMETQLLLRNIRKYITEYKQQEFYNKGDKPIIYFNNRFLDAKFVAECFDILGRTKEDFEISDIKKEFYPTQINTKDVTAVLLPIRVTNEEKRKTIQQFTERFIAELKNKNI